MERWELALRKFINHFGYTPNSPKEISEMYHKYPEILEKSVKDDLDYTIEAYGTNPDKNSKYNPNAIIID